MRHRVNRYKTQWLACLTTEVRALGERSVPVDEVRGRPMAPAAVILTPRGIRGHLRGGLVAKHGAMYVFDFPRIVSVVGGR